MFGKSLIIGAISLCGMLGAQVAVQSAVPAPPSAASVVSNADQDKDGTLDLAEVKSLIGAKTFKAADPDNDGALTKDESLALVEKLFNKADMDHDGTLSVQE